MRAELRFWEWIGVQLRSRLWVLWLMGLLPVGLLSCLLTLAGCGEKMSIFQPTDLFAVKDYLEDNVYEDSAVPIQLSVIEGNLFVVTADGRLTKRDRNYGEIAAVTGLANPRALCQDDDGDLVYVWEQGLKQISVYQSSDLSYVGATSLDTLVLSVYTMVACRTGIENDPNVSGARTFLYLADPDSGVIHRHVYDDFSGLSPYGILARRDGEGARFVHQPAGMAKDGEGMLLVCDADTTRNWVIRFDPVPDFSDTTPDTNDQDPWRGRAVVFDQDFVVCVPPAAADYTLGDAAECGEVGWIGGPSGAAGEFTRPLAVAIDGSHHIFVVDHGNRRIQIFKPKGSYDEVQFGSAEMSQGPVSIGVVDVRTGSGEFDVNYGAYVFVLVPQLQRVHKFISHEQYIHINQVPPPDPG